MVQQVNQPATVETLRAAVDTIVPSVDGAPAASELNAHHHLIEVLDKALPSGADLVASLLDVIAGQTTPETRFVDLDDKERGKVFDALAATGLQDLRDAVDAILIFTLDAVYSEWSGLDRSTGSLSPPKSWTRLGYHGPVLGVPKYRANS